MNKALPYIKVILINASRSGVSVRRFEQGVSSVGN